MSLEALTWAKKIGAPSSGAKYLLIMLANYAGRKGESFYPLTEIADDMQVSVDSVRRRLGELQDAGMIARVARLRNDGSRSSDVVILLMDDETRGFAESLGWTAARVGEAAAEEGDGAEKPGIEPLADCDHPPQIATTPCGICKGVVATVRPPKRTNN
ncbi:helix-turn-helix domain-containing protein [Methylosinus trichosporium]|uniref:helix-turn-helix domain-containing protein n=1 Tax=Methylosinus trichosporium TaxID=426 RepID=UPI0024BAA42D|nr:helix-turn-helix domain-containing protein [Methylosinus trichosporium]